MNLKKKFKHYIAGLVAGISCLVIGHPFDTIKTRQQIHPVSAFRTITSTLRYDGITGFYKGLFFPLLAIGPSNAFFFGIYGCLVSTGGEHEANSPGSIVFYGNEWLIFKSGCIAGSVQTISLCPAELIKSQMQMQSKVKAWSSHTEKFKTSGALQICQKIFMKEGMRGFYRGVTPMAWRDIPSSGLYTLTYETILYSKLDKWNIRNLWKQVIAGGIAGVIAWVPVIPFDVVKTRMQIDACKIKPKYKGMIDCFIKSYQKGGAKIFMQALPTIVFRGFISNSAAFVAYEATIRFIENS